MSRRKECAIVPCRLYHGHTRVIILKVGDKSQSADTWYDQSLDYSNEKHNIHYLIVDP